MKQLLSIILATILLIGNFGFSMSTHYCMGKQMETEIAWVQTSSGCCAKKEVMANCEEEPVAISAEPCCQDISTAIDINAEFSVDVQALPIAKLKAIQPILIVLLALDSSNKLAKPQHPTPIPPLLNRDQQALFQQYLI